MSYFLTGFAGGAFALLAPLYTSETSEKCVTGATSSMTQLMVTLGGGFVAALNIRGAVHWVYITSVCAVIPGKSLKALKSFLLNFLEIKGSQTLTHSC